LVKKGAAYVEDDDHEREQISSRSRTVSTQTAPKRNDRKEGTTADGNADDEVGPVDRYGTISQSEPAGEGT
jgi:hypothetical protein